MKSFTVQELLSAARRAASNQADREEQAAVLAAAAELEADRRTAETCLHVLHMLNYLAAADRAAAPASPGPSN